MFDIAALRSDSFHWSLALSLAYASRIAYENSGTIENLTLQTWGFQTYAMLDVGDTQGFVAATDAVTLVAFRGSESLGDWIGNLASPLSRAATARFIPASSRPSVWFDLNWRARSDRHPLRVIECG